MSDGAVNPMKAGLEDVVVSPSDICFIDGQKGRLVYRGYDVIRPRSDYTGLTDEKYVPLAQR
jgi:citrate synthase